MAKVSTSVNAIAVATSDVPTESLTLEQLIDVKNVDLPTLFDNMVKATMGVYGSYIRIAAKFNELMPFAWYDISHGEKSENNTILKTHKTPLYKALTLAGHSNASVPYGRMCEYARNLRNGLAPNGKTTIDGEPVGEGEGEGNGAANTPRSAMLRNIETLTPLWKFNDKQTELPKQVIAAQAHIEAALKALGLDVAHIAK
jgi:hypothetical protein